MSGDFQLLRIGEAMAFGFDWSDWLDEAETVTDSTWLIGPSTGAPTLSGEDHSTTETSVLVTASSTQFGKTYSLANTITGSSGDTAVRSITMRVVWA